MVEAVVRTNIDGLREAVSSELRSLRDALSPAEPFRNQSESGHHSSKERLVADFPDLHLVEAHVRVILVDLYRVLALFDEHGLEDWSAVVNSCSRVVEIEATQRILKPWKQHLRGSRPELENKELANQLTSSRDRDSNLGTLRHALRLMAGSDSREISFRDREILQKSLSDCFGACADTILNEVQEPLEDFWRSHRNPAAHTEVIERVKATAARDKVIGSADRPGLLAAILKIRPQTAGQ